MKRLQGTIHLPDPRYIPGGVAYVAQTAFLLNGTIRDNVLFGNEYDEARYLETLESCALLRDLENLEGGDLTEIGEKGINLSGGQKQRISLARAVYSPSSIILLDDPLSAVDAPTARHLLKKCILGPPMKGRTRILVTHALGLVFPHADFVVVMKNGEITGTGPRDVVLSNPDLELSLPAPPPYSTEFGKSKDDDEEEDKEEKLDKKILEGISKRGTRIVDDEMRSQGSVKMGVYFTFLTACGGFLFFAMFIVGYMLRSASFLGRDYWVKIWTDSLDPTNSTNTTIFIYPQNHHLNLLVPPTLHPLIYPLMTPHPNTTVIGSLTAVDDGEPKGTGYYIGIYACLSLLVVFAGIAVEMWVLYGSLVASRVMHNRLLERVFHAPLRFFEKTPVGRLLNRFTKDLSTVDTDCLPNFDNVGSTIFDIMQCFVVITVAAPLTFVFLVPMLIAYYAVSSTFLKASRELKRLNSVTISPIYSQFSETLVGASTIRAYGSEKRSARMLDVKLNTNNRNNFYLWTANRWLNLRCELLSSLFTFIVGFFIIESKMSPGWAGLTLSYAFQLTMYLTNLIRCHADLDMSMNAVERIDEYCTIEQEPPFVIEESRPQLNWPDRGEVEVKNLSLRYSPETPLVLKNLSFMVKPHEKIGVVGRTGAGKSTLSLAFFRILPLDHGSIIIDNINIDHIGLHDLRSRLTIIPQDPVLFEGTIRSNIDPLAAHSDQRIWEAVEAVGLLGSMQKGGGSGEGDEVPGSVDSGEVDGGEVPVQEGDKEVVESSTGSFNLDSLVMEGGKATASVDETADSKIQEAIRTAFKDGTVITIAHRLKTIID
ncbi:hypothetical protein HDU67_007573 [Dinochytrium kinnereticum]|nr:hypothetical protein HDU67_007573 [Dinochytrium kinnereticum]